MKSMGHPDYVYTPRPSEVRAKMSRAHRSRLGIPDGHVRVYGVFVPEKQASTIRPYATEMSRLFGYERAHQWVASAASSAWLVDMPRLTDEKKLIDWELVGELLSESMTLEEVAAFINSPLYYVEEKTKKFRRISKRRTGAGRRIHV